MSAARRDASGEPMFVAPNGVGTPDLRLNFG